MGHGAAGLRSPVEAWLRCGPYGGLPKVRVFLGWFTEIMGTVKGKMA